MSDYTPPTLVTPTPGGNPGDGSMNGVLTVQADENTDGLIYLKALSSKSTVLTDSGGGDVELYSPRGGGSFLHDGSGNALGIQGGGNGIEMDLRVVSFKRTTTAGFGLSPIYGLDNRTGLTAADSAAKILYTTTAAGQLYRLMGRILATAGTSPSATYTIKWTEGGATITKTLTISALDSDSDLSVLIQPDNGTAITAQLTAISGTGTTVNVAATVEQMA